MKLLAIILLLIVITCSECGCFLKKNQTNTIAKVKSVPSVEGQWPFLVSFISIPERTFLKNRTYIPDDEHYACTGAILGYRWVLTSFQCIFPLFFSGNYTTVYSGSMQSLSGDKHALKHYRPPVNLNPYLPLGVDIALLELDDFIDTDNVTRSIKISSKMNFEENDNLTIAGYSWYRDINDTSPYQNARHSSISFLSFGDCVEKGDKYTICVGGDVDVDDEEEEEDGIKYQANDASPIISQINGTYFLNGIAVRPSKNSTYFQTIATFLPLWCDWIKYTTREEVNCV